MPNIVYTIGHSTLDLDIFIALLKAQNINMLVDVRAFPASRRYPHFNKDNMQTTLPLSSIQYMHLRALGGRRTKPAGAPPSLNSYWRHNAFRNYADYASSAEFRAGLQELEQAAQDNTCAIMCAEALWWQCHRRIITDYLLADGIEVFHIMGKGKVEQAEMTEAARRAGEYGLIYDLAPAGQTDLFHGDK